MDTTSSTMADGVPSTGYVSCIKVDGNPILPPLMTEELRQEMRMYKEQAIIREKQLKERRKARQDCTRTLLRRSPSTSPVQGVPITSTPRSARVQPLAVVTSSEEQIDGGKFALILEESEPKIFSACGTQSSKNTSGVPEGILRERKILRQSDPNKTINSDPSGGSPALSYDEDEEKGEVSSAGGSIGDVDTDSVDNFTSAASSAGTFIIRRSNAKGCYHTVVSASNELPRKSTDTAEKSGFGTSEDEPDNDENAPPTVLRKRTTDELTFRRKRPAKYFDIDEDKDEFKHLTPPYSDLPHYLPPEIQTDVTRATEKNNDQTSTVPFSPVPLTNFTTMAKSITEEFTKRISSILPTSATIPSPSFASQAVGSQRRSSGGSYEVTLTKKIPSSAEKEVDVEKENLSSSDKENIDTDSKDNMKTHHVRKLSYTLATPSTVLLEAVSRSKATQRPLETVPSVPSSVGVQSANPTPEKLTFTNINTSSSVGLPSTYQIKRVTSPRHENLNSALANLNLGKQAHLERFLTDQKTQQDGKMPDVSGDSEPKQMESVINRLRQEHENRLRDLEKQHRQQEFLLRQEFESELHKIKEKLNSTHNTTNSNIKSFKTSPNYINTSAHSPRSATAISVEFSAPTSAIEELTANTKSTEITNGKLLTSGMSGISLSEATRIDDSSVFQFTGGNNNASSISVQPSSMGSTDLAVVGLSKLQSRFQLMSPKLFRIPVDARSPLLKGLMFPDPLEKPQPPIRLPPKALEPSMKVKFERVSAAVKGHLTRRLLNTEKVQIVVQTIRDTVELLLKLYEEAPAITESMPSVRPQDSGLHQRLVQQLSGACRSFHDVFFKLTIQERMAVIATDREKLKAKAMRSAASPGRPAISNATLKSIERRLSHRVSPKRDNRKSRTSKMQELAGSQSVHAKPLKSFNISPKRRRISYWDGNSARRSSTSLAGGGKQDLNGNSVRTATSSARSQVSAISVLSSQSVRTRQTPASGGMGETFVVPAAVPSNHNRGMIGSINTPGKPYVASSNSARDSYTNMVKSTSARSTQSNISVTSTSGSRSRVSLSRQPWNSPPRENRGISSQKTNMKKIFKH